MNIGSEKLQRFFYGKMNDGLLKQEKLPEKRTAPITGEIIFRGVSHSLIVYSVNSDVSSINRSTTQHIVITIKYRCLTWCHGPLRLSKTT